MNTRRKTSYCSDTAIPDHRFLFMVCLLAGSLFLFAIQGWADGAECCAQVKEATFTQEPESVLPEADGIPGWSAEGDPEAYMPENLYEYNNGAAEVYLSYGFRKLVTRRYIEDGNETNEITVEIYDMDIPLQAFGIYAAERSVNDDFIELGGQGHVSETALGFWQSKFYIKMIFFGTRDDPEQLLVDFGKRISERIEGPTQMPEWFEVFPTRDRIPNTEQVFLSAPLGHSFLSPAYQVSYKSAEDKPAMLLLSVAPNANETAQRLDQYQDHLKKIESPVTAGSPANGYPEGCLLIEDKYLGECVVGHKGRFLVFLMGEALNGPKIMADMWGNLEKRSRKPANEKECEKQ